MNFTFTLLILASALSFSCSAIQLGSQPKLSAPAILPLAAKGDGLPLEELKRIYNQHRISRQYNELYFGRLRVTRKQVGDYWRRSFEAWDLSGTAGLAERFLAPIGYTLWPDLRNPHNEDLHKQWVKATGDPRRTAAFNEELAGRLGITKSEVDISARPVLPELRLQEGLGSSSWKVESKIGFWGNRWRIGDVVHSPEEVVAFMRDTGRPDLATAFEKAGSGLMVSKIAARGGYIIFTGAVFAGAWAAIIGYLSRYGSNSLSSDHVFQNLAIAAGVSLGTGVVGNLTWSSANRDLEKAAKEFNDWVFREN